ncbi:MAG: methyltransferase domain-containing protein [Byssovorax sp.]
MRVTNRYNRVIYRLWAPVYDRAADRLFAIGRRRALELLNLQPGERVLLAGVGTGADLPLLPAGVSALGVDLSPAMLAQARARLPLAGREVALVEGDAQALPVEDASFDAAVLNLILSVVPDGAACLRESLRALRPGGRAVVFDKFVPDDRRPSRGRRLLNLGSTLFGTDITRRFADLRAGAPCEVVRDEPSLLRGAYRVILLRRT